MVAEAGGMDAEGVEDGDVGAAFNPVEGGGGICTRGKERAGDVVVAAGENQRGGGIRGLERIQHRRKPRGVV